MWELDADCGSGEKNPSYKRHKRWMRGMSYKNTNKRIYMEILAGRQELLPSTVKRRKLSWLGHVSRRSTLPKSYYMEQ